MLAHCLGLVGCAWTMSVWNWEVQVGEWQFVLSGLRFGVGWLGLVGRSLCVRVWRWWAHLGATLAYLQGNVGPSWGYVGPSWGYLGPSWGYVGASWSYVGPSWRLCWPILGLCWPILKPMLAHLGPSWAIRSGKLQKVGRAQNTVKRGSFWRGGWSAAGGAAPLSYGEERTACGNATARGPLAGFKRLRATAGQGPNNGTRGGG